MHWVVIFLCLTMPFVMGVAFTLAVPESNPPYGLGTVVIVAACWLVIAYQVGRFVTQWKPHSSVRCWLLLVVLLPLVVALLFHVWKDPQVRSAWANLKPLPVTEHLAPAAPSRHMPSWTQTGAFLASMQHPAQRYLIQLCTCLPPLWWIAALVLALWKGK